MQIILSGLFDIEIENSEVMDEGLKSLFKLKNL